MGRNGIETLIVRPPRKNVLLSARIEAGGLDAPVRIRNMSAGGAMLDGPALPDVGSIAILRRLQLAVEATIIWKENDRCGLALRNTVAVDDWINGTLAKGVPQFGQIRVDAIQAAIRNGCEPLAVQPSPIAETVEPACINERIAEELLFVKRLLDAVGDELTDDPTVLSRFPRALQNFDIACQIIGHLGTVVAADNREVAIRGVAMHDLRNRLSGQPVIQ